MLQSTLLTTQVDVKRPPYASNIPVVKEVEGIVDPAAFTVVRFALAAIPFLPFIVRARDNVQTRLAGVELGFWISLGYLMQALGLQTSDAGRASFISLFTVIVVPLLDGALGATVPARTWFGAFMSVLGVALLESSGSPPSVGDFLNFLSAVFFGVHMLRTEHVSRSTKRKDILPLLGYEVIVIAILSAIGISLEKYLGAHMDGTLDRGLGLRCGIGLLNFPGYLHFIQAYSQRVCAYG
ncbi:hypothetical protein GIB67_010894 [Kingdonia uniflora]|uniref:EamA domain-containing protein n=1 Tax=Kingdonia uniflora TaxID=39325 RepID=A0A7J7M4S9_9MAGN|nr:hypothetical protein GIB67_010894 [Kingdonia uniflora]